MSHLILIFLRPVFPSTLPFPFPTAFISTAVHLCLSTSSEPTDTMDAWEVYNDAMKPFYEYQRQYEELRQMKRENKARRLNEKRGSAEINTSIDGSTMKLEKQRDQQKT